jgi:hypothetical protein
MVNALQFNLSVPTPYVFMRRFLKASQCDRKVCTTGLHTKNLTALNRIFNEMVLIILNQLLF